MGADWFSTLAKALFMVGLFGTFYLSYRDSRATKPLPAAVLWGAVVATTAAAALVYVSAWGAAFSGEVRSIREPRRSSDLLLDVRTAAGDRTVRIEMLPHAACNEGDHLEKAARQLDVRCNGRVTRIARRPLVLPSYAAVFIGVLTGFVRWRSWRK